MPPGSTALVWVKSIKPVQPSDSFLDPLPQDTDSQARTVSQDTAETKVQYWSPWPQFYSPSQPLLSHNLRAEYPKLAR